MLRINLIAIVLICALSSTLLFSCENANTKVAKKVTHKKIIKSHKPFGKDLSGDTVYNASNSYSTSTKDSIDHTTRVRFPNFTIIIKQFKGYSSPPDNVNELDSSERVEGHYTFNYLDRPWVRNEEGAWRDTLIATADSVFSNEDLDERINNTLFQIVPLNKEDHFKITASYFSTLSEIIDERKYKRELLEKMYLTALKYKEHTPGII